jgi:hypothetical protein
MITMPAEERNATFLEEVIQETPGARHAAAGADLEGLWRQAEGRDAAGFR